MPAPAPMLATAMGPHELPEQFIASLTASGKWMFEFKFDGIRAIIECVDGTVTITNRTGRDITDRYPDVVEALTGLPDLVLDGEIVCPDEQGRPDFSRAHRRDCQSNKFAIARLARTCPAQFVVFDVLSLAGTDLRRKQYKARRTQITKLAPVLVEHRIVVPPVSTDGAMMWKVVREMDLEGLVAKRLDSIYVDRRAQTWVKIKRKLRISALVCGYEPGQGSREGSFGALNLAVLDDDEMVEIGSVGAGFTESDLRRIWKLLQRPNEEIIVEVEFLEVSPNGHLRQPVFKGLRLDVPADSCVLSQLVMPAAAG